MKKIILTLGMIHFGVSLFAQLPCSLDNTFATGGKLISDGSRLGDNVLVQPDGKILIACNPFGNGHVYIKRLNVDGSVDMSYGINGNCSIMVSTDATRISDMAFYNNQVYVCGNTSGNSNTFPFAAAISANGTLLSSFGNSGIKTFPSNFYTCAALDIDASGNLFITGSYSLTELFVAKLNSAGTFDASFDGDGVATLATGDVNHWFEAFDILSDKNGKVIMCGKKYKANNGSTINPFWNALVVRFTSTGALDNSFATNGVGLYNSSATNFDELKKVHQLPNNDYIFCGDTYDNVDYDYNVLKLKNDGTKDVTFGNQGWQLHDLEYDNEMENPLNSALLPDGRILITGNQGSGDTVYFALLMLKADGTRDNSFAPNGFFKNIFGANNNSSSAGMALDASGKIVLAGYTRTCANGTCGPLYMAVSRYNSSFIANGANNINSPTQLLSCYPNPIQPGREIFILNEQTTESSFLFLYSENGNCVAKLAINQNKATLPISITPGTYILALPNKKGVSKNKLIVH